MMCEVCGKKEATVLYTHVAGDQKKSIHMCSDCVTAHKVKLRGDAGTPSSASSRKAAGHKAEKKAAQEKVEETGEPQGVEQRCGHCGIGFQDFRKRGRLGCHRCYESFESELGPLLKRIHGSLDHCGKGRVAQQSTPVGSSELEELNRALARAVTAEAYEQAAELRDRIRTLSTGLGADGGVHTGAAPREDS